MKIFISSYYTDQYMWAEYIEASVEVGYGSLDELLNSIWEKDLNLLNNAEFFEYEKTMYGVSNVIKFLEYEKTVYIMDNIKSVDVKFIREIPLAEIKKLIMLR